MVVDDAGSFFWFAMLPFAGGFGRAIGTVRRWAREKNRMNARVGKTLGNVGLGVTKGSRGLQPAPRVSVNGDHSGTFRPVAAPRVAASRAEELTPEQLAEAERIEERLAELIGVEIRELALLLASKPSHQLLRIEFEVRDRLKTIGVKAIEAAMAERQVHRVPRG